MSGNFVWFDLSTTDLAAAKAFYTELLGWGTDTGDFGGTEYTMWKIGDRTFGGMMPLQDEARRMGVPPNWLGYVRVEDVDAAARKCGSLGGRVLLPGTDIPNVGRFAVLSDPQGAAIAVYREREAPAEGYPEAVDWHELYTTDVDAAFSFYEAMFGWRKDQAIDMGPDGTYQTFASGDRVLGGMMRRPANMPVSAWTYYFRVADTHATTERARALGANVLVGPMQVPGGGWVTIFTDPQGATFAIVGPGKP